MHRFAAVALLLCAGVALPAFAQVEVTYLGNEGVLLRSRTAGVLLDALHGPHMGYAFPPASLIEKIVAGRAPYDNVRLVLVSHVHADHFDPAMVARFLQQNPAATLASSDHIVKAVRALLPATAAKRAEPVTPEPRTSESLRRPGVEVTFLGLPHDGQRPWQELRNLGHIVTIGGLKVLHVGDAKMDPGAFAAFGLSKQNIDLALLPGWYLAYPEGQRLVREHIRPKHFLAVHVKETEAAELRAKIRDAFPDAAVLAKIGETLRFGSTR